MSIQVSFMLSEHTELTPVGHATFGSVRIDGGAAQNIQGAPIELRRLARALAEAADKADALAQVTA